MLRAFLSEKSNDFIRKNIPQIQNHNNYNDIIDYFHEDEEDNTNFCNDAKLIEIDISPSSSSSLLSLAPLEQMEVLTRIFQYVTNTDNTNIKQLKYIVLKKVLELVNNDILINGQRSKVMIILKL